METRDPADDGPTPVEELVSGRPYRVLRMLGAGGTSAVYLVEHLFMLRRFALKVLHPFRSRRPEAVDRVRVEAQAIGRLQHPNVVDVVDFWRGSDGTPCLILELLEGRTLARELDVRHRLPAAEAVDLASQALSALAAAHDIGIVHRDVKPENLFLHTKLGQKRLLKVLDFGLARVLPDVSPHAPAPPIVPTSTGAVIGSPRFMSPEASRGERVGPEADIYSLGAVLYLMLTGRGPHEGTSRPEPPSKYGGPDVSSDLDAIVLRAIEDTPGARHSSAGAFRDALVALGFTGTKTTR
jgi:serine/threonine-protein kinase